MKLATITKNRNREKYTFANINLLGNCSVDCFFCLGKDLENELVGKNQLRTHFSKWDNFSKFISRCKQEEVNKLYLTAQNTDPLLYVHFDELVAHLKDQGFEVGVRTGGYWPLKKVKSLKKLNGEIGLSFNSISEANSKLILGRAKVPKWDLIVPECGDNVRVSIVVNKFNIHEIFPMIEYAASFKNVRYIQMRRISTDNRFEELKEHIEIYEKLYERVQRDFPRIGTFYLAEQFSMYGKEVNFWRTVQTSVNSLNYFTDGTLSDNYFIVEGYLENQDGKD